MTLKVTKLYDKRDDFNFPIVNFPYLCNNIPSPVCDVLSLIGLDTQVHALCMINL